MSLSTLLLAVSLCLTGISAQLLVQFVPASQLMPMGGPRVVMAPMFVPGSGRPGMTPGMDGMASAMQPGMAGMTSGMTQSAMGTQQFGMSGLSPIGMDMSQAGMGMSQTGMGMSQAGMGMSQTGMGMSQLGMGMSQPGMGMSQLGMGMSQPGIGMSQTGMGMSGASWDPSMSQGQGSMFMPGSMGWNQVPYTVGQDMNTQQFGAQDAWGSAFGIGAMSGGMSQTGMPGAMSQPGAMDQNAATGGMSTTGLNNPSGSLLQGTGAGSTGQSFSMSPDGFTNPGQTPTGRRK